MNKLLLATLKVLAESKNENRAKSIAEEVARIIRGKITDIKIHSETNIAIVVEQDSDVMIEVNYLDGAGEIRVIYGNVGANMQALKGLARRTDLELVVEND